MGDTIAALAHRALGGTTDAAPGEVQEQAFLMLIIGFAWLVLSVVGGFLLGDSLGDLVGSVGVAAIGLFFLGRLVYMTRGW